MHFGNQTNILKPVKKMSKVNCSVLSLHWVYFLICGFDIAVDVGIDFPCLTLATWCITQDKVKR